MDLCLQYIEKSPGTNIKFTFFTGDFSMYCIHTVYIEISLRGGRLPKVYLDLFRIVLGLLWVGLDFLWGSFRVYLFN